MKILITGSQGYVGSLVLNQINILQKFYQMNDQSFDIEITSLEKITDFNLKRLRKSEFDFLFHCAVIGGRSFESNNEEVYYENLNLFLEILTLNVNKIIHFTSAADLDRSKGIDLVDPYEIFTRNPIDYFGKAKNEISKIILEKNLGLNLRIFNLFGSQSHHRYQFIDNIFKWSRTKKEIIIQEDRSFDFFYIEDLRPVIHEILNNNIGEDINLCYDQKYSISSVANHIISLNNSNSKIFIQNQGLPYTGSNTKIRLSVFDQDLLERISDYKQNSYLNK